MSVRKTTYYVLFLFPLILFFFPFYNVLIFFTLKRRQGRQVICRHFLNSLLINLKRLHLDLLRKILYLNMERKHLIWFITGSCKIKDELPLNGLINLHGPIQGNSWYVHLPFHKILYFIEVGKSLGWVDP